MLKALVSEIAVFSCATALFSLTKSTTCDACLWAGQIAMLLWAMLS